MMGISIHTHGIILPQMSSRTGIIYNCDRAIETNHAIKETDIRRRGRRGGGGGGGGRRR